VHYIYKVSSLTVCITYVKTKNKPNVKRLAPFGAATRTHGLTTQQANGLCSLEHTIYLHWHSPTNTDPINFNTLILKTNGLATLLSKLIEDNKNSLTREATRISCKIIHTQLFDRKKLTIVVPRAPLPPYTITRPGTAIATLPMNAKQMPRPPHAQCND